MLTLGTASVAHLVTFLLALLILVNKLARMFTVSFSNLNRSSMLGKKC